VIEILEATHVILAAFSQIVSMRSHTQEHRIVRYGKIIKDYVAEH